MPTKTKKTRKHWKDAQNYAKSNKFILLIGVIVFLVAGNFLYNKYLDWDNAQMIRGLSRDFPVLIEQIERETGLELNIDSNCMQTQEKFSDGVNTCEYLAVDNTDDEKLVGAAQRVMLESDLFGSAELSDNGRGYRVEYRNKNSCTLSNRNRIYISCIIGVRDANKDLAKLLQ